VYCKYDPKSFDEFVGQADVINELKIQVGAAKSQHRALEHVLFSGPPGLG
jgi:Holliday junction DNA helicase RuvB